MSVTAFEESAPGVGTTGSRPGAMGFLTDTTLCIGCKACEVACKQWNQLPMDNMAFTGFSYDNTGHLGAALPEQLADDERRVQALRPGRLSGGLPDWRDRPHRVRHRRDPAGRVQ